MTQQDRINNQREQLKLFRKSLKRYADVSGKVPKELIEEFDKKYRHYVTYFENNERRPAETAAMGRLGAEMLNDFAQIFNPNGSVNLNEEAVNYRKNMVKEADTAGTDKIQELIETLAFSECFDVYADAVISNYGKEIFDYEEENDPQIKDWHMEVRKLEDKALNEQRELDDLRRKLLGSVVNSGLGTLFELPGNKPTNYDSIVNENFSKEKEAWKRVNSFYRNRANKDGLPKEYDIKAAIEDLKLIEDGIFEFFANELPVEGFNVTEDERVFAKQLLDTQYNLSLLIDETEANGRKFAQQVAQKAMAGEAIDDIKAQMNEAELEANRLNGYNAFIKDKIGVIRKLQQIVSNIEKLSFYKDR